MGSVAGEQLEVEAAEATPAHQYVPWILVEGVPLGEQKLLDLKATWPWSCLSQNRHLSM